MSEAIYNVLSTALFFARPQPDTRMLLAQLNELFRAEEGCFLSKSELSHPDWTLLSCEKFHIMLTFSDAPAAPEKFKSALASEHTALREFDFDHAVLGHKAFVQIEVGDGSAPLPPEAREIMAEFGSVSACDPQLKLLAHHFTQMAIARHEGFLALHYDASDLLVSSAELSGLSDREMPLPLFFHPVAETAQAGPGGKMAYGVRCPGTEILIGRTMRLEGLPVSVPLATCLNLTKTLVTSCLKGKLALQDGEVLRNNPKLSLYVRHDQDAETGEEQVIVSFWSPEIQAQMDPQVATADMARAQAADMPAAAPVREDITLRSLAPVAAPAPARAPAPAPVAAAADPAPVSETAAPARDRAPLEAVETSAPPAYDHGRVPQYMDMIDDDIPARPGWLASAFSRIPVSAKVKVAGIAAVIALPMIWTQVSAASEHMSLGMIGSVKVQKEQPAEPLLLQAALSD